VVPGILKDYSCLHVQSPLTRRHNLTYQKNLELSHDRVMLSHGCATRHWTGTDKFEVVEKVSLVGIN